LLITVSGPPGSGTTTAATHVAARLEIRLVPGGKVFRAMAVEQGLTLPEFGAYAAEHPEVDVELDRRLAALARGGDAVIESRLAGWIAHNEGLTAVTVWIDCDPEVRAARVAEREGVALDEARADNDERHAIERARYAALYGLDLADTSVYNLVLDSVALGPTEIADRIVEAAHKLFA
jgi:predicted cytidylate kinase